MTIPIRGSLALPVWMSYYIAWINVNGMPSIVHKHMCASYRQKCINSQMFRWWQKRVLFGIWEQKIWTVNGNRRIQTYAHWLDDTIKMLVIAIRHTPLLYLKFAFHFQSMMFSYLIGQWQSRVLGTSHNEDNMFCRYPL